jgi:hypothetical protein
MHGSDFSIDLGRETAFLRDNGRNLLMPAYAHVVDKTNWYEGV